MFRVRRTFVSTICTAALCWGLCGNTQAAQTTNMFPDDVKRELRRYKIPQSAASLYLKEINAPTALYSVNAGVPRNPASVIKLLTTMAALDILTPAFTWKTQVLTNGVVRNGILHGNLYLRGNGDPYLIQENFWHLLQNIRQRGIREIRGDLVIDESEFAVEDTDPGLFDDKPTRVYNGLPSALLVNFWATRFVVTATETGVEINAIPPVDGLEIVNNIKHSTASCKAKNRRIGFNFDVRPEKTTATFGGRLSNRCKSWEITRAVVPSERYAHGVFRALWRNMGGEVQGANRFAHTPENTRLVYEQESRPLAEIIRGVNKFSNNLMARQLLLTTAAQIYPPPASKRTARFAVQSWMTYAQISDDHLFLDNGSGLSRQSRITAQSLGDLLEFAHRSRYRPEFLSSLSLVGMDGLLTKRFVDEDLSGLVRMKTGTIDHVRALAGYIETRNGKDLIVALLINHKGVHLGTGTAVQDALIRWAFEL